MKLIEPVDAIYLRKSKLDLELEEQGEGETLARHKKILLDIAKKQGLNIGEIYQEVVSGESIQDRPEMQRLLNDVMDGQYRSVMVMEVQRLARGNTKDQGEVAEAFKYSSTKIVTPQKTYDANNEYDEEYLEFGLYMSRREFTAINRRMSIGKIQSVKEGNYIGSLPPFGYDVVKKAKRDRTLVFNDQSKYVKMMFDWHIDERLSPCEIGARLKSMGVKTRTGKDEWNRGTIKDILSNHLYCGKIRWNKRKQTKVYDRETGLKTKHRPDSKEYIVVEGKHEGIISEERFELAQSFFGTRPPTAPKDLVNIFAGVIFCKKCGKAMQYHRMLNRPNVKIKYVHAAGYSCKIKPLAYDDFLNIIINSLNDKISDFSVKLGNYSLDTKKAEYDEIRNDLDTSLAKEKKKLNRLFNDFEEQEDEELYTKEEFKERKLVISSRIKNIKSQIESLVVPSSTEYEQKISTFSELLETFKDSSKSNTHKNMLIKTIIKRIDYSYTNDINLDIIFNL